MQFKNIAAGLLFLISSTSIVHCFRHWQISRSRKSHSIKSCDNYLRRGIFAIHSDSEDAIILTPEDIYSSKRQELLDAIDLYNTNKKASWLTEELGDKKKKSKGFLGAETRGAQTIVINEEGQRIIELIEGLAKYNPTAVPLQGFLGYKEVRRACAICSVSHKRYHH